MYLKSVRTSRMDPFLNLSPLYTHVSRKVISVSENFNREFYGRFESVIVGNSIQFNSILLPLEVVT